MCQYCRKVHAGTEELYDLVNDPEENSNLASSRPEQAARLRAEAESLLRDLDQKREQERRDSDPGPDPGPDPLDSKEQRKIRKTLKSLGYMD